MITTDRKLIVIIGILALTIGLSFSLVLASHGGSSQPVGTGAFAARIQAVPPPSPSPIFLANVFTQVLDFGTTNEIANDVVIDSTGNTIAVGRDGSADPQWRIVKLNSAGSVILNFAFNPSATAFQEQANGVAVDSSNNMIVVGSDWSLGNEQWLIRKYSSTGTLIWTRAINPSTGTDTVQKVAVDSAGNIIVAGHDSVLGSGNTQWRVHKLNGATGADIWVRNYNSGTRRDEAFDVTVDSNNDIIVVGLDSLSTFNNRWATRKIDTNGNLLWTVQFDFAGGTDVANRVVVDPSNNVYVGGTVTELGVPRPFLKKYSPAGVQLASVKLDPIAAAGAASGDFGGIAIDSGNLFAGITQRLPDFTSNWTINVYNDAITETKFNGGTDPTAASDFITNVYFGNGLFVEVGSQNFLDDWRIEAYSVSLAPPAAVCGNGLKETGELCDGTDVGSETCASQGFTGGTLVCNATCNGFDTSGCFIAVCGNGIKEGTEECDGADLGGNSCEILSFLSGTLSCNPSCTFDTSSCSGTAVSCGTTITSPGLYGPRAGGISGASGACITINSNNVDFDCRGRTITGEDQINSYGIRIGSSSATQTNVTIRNCTFVDWHRGILAQNPSGAFSGGATFSLFTNNTFISNIAGVTIGRPSTNNIVENSTFSNNIVGLELANDDIRSTVRNNLVSNNNIGAYMTNSEFNILINNNLDSNQVGVQIDGSRRNTIISNNLTQNTNASILVRFHSDNVTISNNFISNNPIGINMSLSGSFIGAPSNTIKSNSITSSSNTGVLIRNDGSRVIPIIARDNNITNNANGLTVLAGTIYNNQIYNNNFISNTVQASDSSSGGNVFNLSYGTLVSPGPRGNYWDNFDEDSEGCFDNNNGPAQDDIRFGDAICDSPFMFSGNQDSLPWRVADCWKETATGAIVATSTATFPVANGANGWFITDPTIDLQADSNSVCLPPIINWILNAGTPQVAGVLASFTITTEGINTLEFWATAGGAFEETPHNFETFLLDKTPPTSELGLLLQFDGDGLISIVWNATDAVSGIDEVQIFRDASLIHTTNLAGGSIVDDLSAITNDGLTFTYTAVAKDVAGHTTTSAARTTTVDLSPPDIPVLQPLPAFLPVSVINIDWNNVVDVTAGVDFYSVFRADTFFPTDISGFVTSSLAQVFEPTSNFIQSGFAEGQTLKYQVSATDKAVPSHESNKSDPAITTIDLTPPVTTIGQIAGLAGNNGWFISSPVTVELDCFDAISGCAFTLNTVSGNNTIFVIGNEGNNSFVFSSQDVAGHVEVQQTAYVAIDTVPPVTTPVIPLSLWGPIINGWFIDDVTVLLDAIDVTSGVDQIFLDIDDGNGFQPYSQGSPTVIDAQTSVPLRTIFFFTRDIAGNNETPQNLTLQIDTIKPSTTAELLGTEINGWFVTDVTIKLNATDNESGLDQTFYSIDGGPFAVYDDFNRPEVSRFSTGEHNVTFYSVDVAGNTEDEATVFFRIDSEPPITDIELLGTIINGWFVTNVTIKLNATDEDLSGVNQTLYSIDGAPYEVYDDFNRPVVPKSLVGFHNVSFFSIDNVGNQEDPPGFEEFKIDSIAPTTTKEVIDSDNDGVEDSAILFCLDEQSGCDVIRITFDSTVLDFTCTDPYDCSTEITIPGGIHILTFYSIDRAENIEDAITQQHEGDNCPGVTGFAQYQGCPVADKNNFVLHTINQAKLPTECGGAGSCNEPIVNARIKVFDRNDLNFQSNYTKNPSGTIYNAVYEAGIGEISSCITNSSGICFAGEKKIGDYLVIAKFVDPKTGRTVYAGLPKSPSDFKDTAIDADKLPDLATKDLNIVKVIPKGCTTNNCITYRGGSKTVISGSILEIVYPTDVIWLENKEVYPFIFTSDSDWTVNVCLQIPEGYQIEGVLDENGNLVTNTDCTQTFVTGETKVVIFSVIRTSSPEPNFIAAISATHEGSTQRVEIPISGSKRETAENEQRQAQQALQQIGGGGGARQAPVQIVETPSPEPTQQEPARAEPAVQQPIPTQQVQQKDSMGLALLLLSMLTIVLLLIWYSSRYNRIVKKRMPEPPRPSRSIRRRI